MVMFLLLLNKVSWFSSWLGCVELIQTAVEGLRIVLYPLNWSTFVPWRYMDGSSVTFCASGCVAVKAQGKCSGKQ